MNARIVRFVATAVTAAVVSVMGAGLANASAADQLEHQVAAATGQNTHTVAEYLNQMHDYLKAAVAADNVQAVDAAIKNLRPVLGAVSQAPVERAAAVLTDRADSQAAQVERGLPGLSLLGPVVDLLKSLIDTVLDLVASLLGGAGGDGGGLPLPLPLPDLPLPGLPALPALPGVPTPSVPALPAPPAAPAPAPAPAPEVPAVPAP